MNLSEQSTQTLCPIALYEGNDNDDVKLLIQQANSAQMPCDHYTMQAHPNRAWKQSFFKVSSPTPPTPFAAALWSHKFLNL